MGLSLSLLLIFLLFCLLMAALLAVCLRERRRLQPSGRDATIDHSAAVNSIPLSLHSAPHSQVDEDADQRTALVLFGSIFLGALLAILTGYLVFFREWAV